MVTHDGTVQYSPLLWSVVIWRQYLLM